MIIMFFRRPGQAHHAAYAAYAKTPLPIETIGKGNIVALEHHPEMEHEEVQAYLMQRLAQLDEALASYHEALGNAAAVVIT